jgi:NADPH:quinone reductase-like Zn-dependent oxidoreductase
VLVRVHAASVHPDVWHVVTGAPYALRLMGAGLRKPRNRVPGTDLAGRVEVVGRAVTRFRPGDEVLGESVRRHQWQNGGAFAEYACVRETALAVKPQRITFEQAAAVPTSALIAVRGIRDEGRVQPGERVLVNGAGGGVGTFAVQLAKAEGAHVTAVDRADKLDLLRSIGADHVLDYAREDFTQGAERYDVIVDVAGNHSLARCRSALNDDGTYVLIGHDHFGAAGGRWIGSLGRFGKLVALSPFVRQLPALRGPRTRDPLALVTSLIEDGSVTPVVDRAFPLSDAADAIRYLATGAARGKVVLTI